MISIIMPYLNEEDVINTINSINNTIDTDYEIIAIDDYSDNITDLSMFKNVHHIRNPNRIGVDESRDLGVSLAKYNNILIIDSHMRFNKGWAKKIIDCIKREPKTIWCTTCLALGYGNMDIDRAKERYYGATILFTDKNCNPNLPAREILEPKWASKKDELEYEIPCILGANYAFDKNWYNYIHGLKGLKMWGTSEPFLSIKSWLAGGQCKITTEVEIGHKFRNNAPYATPIWTMVYNKLFLCKTTLDNELSEKLIGYMVKNAPFNLAMTNIINNSKFIEEERKYYDSIFRRNIYDYCSHFKINLP
jgi:glycosyltransferase involved in cell wall biosynthesis